MSVGNLAPQMAGIRFLTRKPEASMVPRKLFTWHNAMFVREEDLMAMSLLYALLGVNDTKDLEQIELKHKAYDAAKLKALETNAEFQDEKRALKYRDLRSSNPKKQREILNALYNTLYHIVEYRDINRDVNMVIGMALCNAINGTFQNLQSEYGIERLQYILKPIVTEAIDEAPQP